MSFLVKRIGVPIAETISRLPVRKYLRELLRTQWLTTDEIREIQNQKLVAIIDHAYNNVPFYREAMIEHNVTPKDIHSTEDLAKLPIITKDIVRANFPDNMISDKFKFSRLIEMTSSGSTDEPFRFVLNREEKARKWAGLYRFWDWAGYTLGDRIVNIQVFPLRVFKKIKALQYLETKYSGILGLPAAELYTDNANSFIDKIVQFKPKAVRGYSSTLSYLAQTLIDTDTKLKVSAVCTTGETLHKYQRELINKAFGCKVFDGYGGEGMEVAAQCDHNDGYHINAENVFVEILNEDGKPCKPGEEGQIVLTDLNRSSMPFIRYNIQDLGVLSDRQCSCGRGLPMLERISGRLTDVGVTPSGKLISAYFFSVLFREVVPRIKQFQVIHEQRDRLLIYIVPGEGFEEVRDFLNRRIQEGIGSDVSFKIKTVDEIPLAQSGKIRLFVSNHGIKPVGMTEEDG